MKCYSEQFVRIYFMLLAFSLCTKLFAAPPVRDKILEDVIITHDNGHPVIEVHFPFRMRYQSHFPTNRGRELRIRLQPVTVPTSDLDAVFKRESVIPIDAKTVALDEVAYEGDIDSGPQLTLLFTKDVDYEVVPDSDYTHIRIIVLSTD